MFFPTNSLISEHPLFLSFAFADCPAIIPYYFSFAHLLHLLQFSPSLQGPAHAWLCKYIACEVCWVNRDSINHQRYIHRSTSHIQHGKACVAAGMSITWAWQSSSGMFALNEMHPFRWRSLQTKIQAARRRLAYVLVLPSCEVLQSWKARLKLDKNDKNLAWTTLDNYN